MASENGERLRDLHEAGTLHRKLLIRVRMLSVIGVVLLAISYIDVLRNGLNYYLCILFGAVGFILGVTIFSRMSKVVWDEESEVISTGRMDVIGVAAIVLYVLFDIGIRHLFKAEFSNVAGVTGYVFATIGGSLLGRSIGTRRAIYRKLAKLQEGKEGTE